MGGDHGRRLTRRERSAIRARIAAGETHWEVAEAIDCSTKTVQRLLVKTGGLPSRARPRSPLRLSLAEREEISRGLRAGDSCRAIARRLGRAPSTVSREVAAHGSRKRYRAWRADEQAVWAARRPKLPKLARHPRLRAEVERRLPSDGPRSRLHGVWRWTFPMTPRCACRTRRSTDRCSSRPEAACGRS